MDSIRLPPDKPEEANKALDFFVMKKTLESFCRQEAKALAWDECITEVNHAVMDAYLFAEFYILRQLKAGRPICKIGQEFYQSCLSFVMNPARTALSFREKYDQEALNRAEKDRNQSWRDGGKVGRMKDAPITVPEFSEAAFKEWIDSLKVDVDSATAGHEFNKLCGGRPTANTQYLNQGWFQEAAKQMATNASNLFARNFAKRLRSYVRERYQVPAAVAQMFESVYVRMADPIVVELLEQIPRTEDGKVSWAPNDLLPMYYKFLRFIDVCNRANAADPTYVAKRTFSLLPTKRGFEFSYCTVDSTGLRSLLLRSPRVDRALAVEHDGSLWTLQESLKNNATWTALADLWWRKLFHVDEMEKEGVRSFHREISTDGYGVGVHMNRPTRGIPKRKKKDKKASDENVSYALGFPLPKRPAAGKAIEDYDVIWGIDPGRTDFITATNQDGKTIRFRTSSFRRASGFTRSNRKSKRRLDRSPYVRRLLKMTPTKKTTCLTELIQAIEFAFDYGRELLEFFMDPFLHKLKFRRITLRTAQLDHACHELAGKPGTKTIIGFGDSGTAGEGVIKKCPAGPVKAFARRLKQHCEVVVVNEFRTSKVHHDCGALADLENQREERVCRDGIKRKVPVHKVLHCLTRSGGCGEG